jgi:hypothetical protein
MKPIYLLLLAAPLFLNLHCKKDAEPEITKDPDPCELYGTHDARCRAQELARLPTYTEVGAGTFGCLLNGKAFIPSTCCGDFFNPPLPKLTSIYYQKDQGYFFGSQNRTDKNLPYFELGITLFIELNSITPFQINVRRFNYDNKQSGGNAIYFSNNTKVYFESFDSISGYTLINLIDTIKQTISGTFEYKAANETDTVYISDGRFDLPYSLQ